MKLKLFSAGLRHRQHRGLPRSDFLKGANGCQNYIKILLLMSEGWYFIILPRQQNDLRPALKLLPIEINKFVIKIIFIYHCIYIIHYVYTLCLCLKLYKLLYQMFMLGSIYMWC